jgi:uncharacterized membrane protein YphA (DoxX/SURF4 family)
MNDLTICNDNRESIPRNSRFEPFRRAYRRMHPPARMFLGAVFVWASLDKIIHPQAFSKIVNNYQILPELLVPAAALGLPWVEIICGLCLVTGRLALGAAFLIDIALTIFIFALMFNFYRGIDINCGCFITSDGSTSSTLTTVARNIALLGIGIMVLAEEIRRHNTPPNTGL